MNTRLMLWNQTKVDKYWQTAQTRILWVVCVNKAETREAVDCQMFISCEIRVAVEVAMVIQVQHSLWLKIHSNLVLNYFYLRRKKSHKYSRASVSTTRLSKISGTFVFLVYKNVNT